MGKLITWNYDDVGSNILSVLIDKIPIGYFRIKSGKFIFISDVMVDYKSPEFGIEVFKEIAREYDDAIRLAKKLIKQDK